MFEKLVRFSKSSKDVLKYKEGLFSDNQNNLALAERISDLYKEQDLRTLCKICEFELSQDDIFFERFGINYKVCQHCGHLNGAFQDSNTFNKMLYEGGKHGDAKATYSRVYNSSTKSEFANRTRDIYIPKAQFLFDTLVTQGVTIKNWKILDYGAGSGYMVKALRDVFGGKISGVEPSHDQCDFANKMLGDNSVSLTPIEEMNSVLKSTDASIVTMIGIVEHLEKPLDLFDTIKNNGNIEYLFITFPMFSPTCLVEAVFPQVFPRHLSGGHTHLFTQKSIGICAARSSLHPLGEWWFGEDALDIMRSIFVSLRDSQSKKSAEVWWEWISEIIDPVQELIDRKYLSCRTQQIWARKLV